MILNHIQANTEGDAIAFLIKDNYFISLSIQDLPCNAFSHEVPYLQILTLYFVHCSSKGKKTEHTCRKTDFYSIFLMGKNNFLIKRHFYFLFTSG